jgi:hypothetical protein
MSIDGNLGILIFLFPVICGSNEGLEIGLKKNLAAIDKNYG